MVSPFQKIEQDDVTENRALERERQCRLEQQLGDWQGSNGSCTAQLLARMIYSSR